MPKTKKSRIASAALGSLAGVATVASIASVIACGHGGGSQNPHQDLQVPVDTSAIKNFDDAKIFLDGTSTGFPLLPKGVHYDYWLKPEGSPNESVPQGMPGVRVVHSLKELHLVFGSYVNFQLGADEGYVISDLQENNGLFVSRATNAEEEKEQEKIIAQVEAAHIYSDGTTIGLALPPDSHYKFYVSGNIHDDYLKPDGSMNPNVINNSVFVTIEILFTPPSGSAYAIASVNLTIESR